MQILHSTEYTYLDLDLDDLLVESVRTVYLVVDLEQKLAVEEALLVETMEEEEEVLVVEPLTATVSAY